MRHWVVVGVAAVGLLAAAGLARGEGSPVAPVPAGSLDLSIRGGALGIVPDLRSGATSLGLEPVRAPTEAGSSRMPRAASAGAPGIYLGVVVCDPDGIQRVYQVRIDEKWELPEGHLRGTPGTRGLFIPGRPIPGP